ncbi:Ubiquinone biosynthesis protein COQ7 -like protein [Trichinella sp. T6]|nr:Ubiquinone biosynthesis protein COQ7 -like protein [Trichinella sp. T6]
MWIKIVRGFCTETNRQRLLDRIIRVDHAGELGAARIYAGQLFILRQRPLAMTIQWMFIRKVSILPYCSGVSGCRFSGGCGFRDVQLYNIIDVEGTVYVFSDSKFFHKTAAYIQFFKGQSLFAIG